MKRILGALLAFVLILILTPILANADDFIPPGPFYIFSEDGTKVFHVTPELREDLITWDKDDFTATGLYYNTDPPIPIYLVRSPFIACTFGYLWEQDFIFSRDMRYFAWIPTTNTKNTALVFFANGVAQRTYMVSDLVYDEDAITMTTTTVRWMYNRHQTTMFDAQTNLLTVQTVDGHTYVFDITSGEIIETTRPPFQGSWVQITVLIAIGVVVLIGGIAFLRLKRRRAE